MTQANPNIIRYLESELGGDGTLSTYLSSTTPPVSLLACWILDGHSQWDCFCFDFHDVLYVSLGVFGSTSVIAGNVIGRHLGCKAVYNSWRCGCQKFGVGVWTALQAVSG